jgi:capsular polysaccharide biosynthesis protein
VDLVSAVQVLLRRWYVTLPLLLVTAALGAAAWLVVSPSYQAQGSLLLRPPPPVAEPDEEVFNPYLLYNNLQIPARVAQDVLLQTAELESLADQGATGAFDVFLDPTGTTPLVAFTAVGATEDEAVETAEIAMARFDEILVQRQLSEGSPEGRLITTEVVTEAAVSEVLVGSKIRAAVAALGLGLILTVSLALMVEALARRRSRPNDDDMSSAHTDAPSPPAVVKKVAAARAGVSDEDSVTSAADGEDRSRSAKPPGSRPTEPSGTRQGHEPHPTGPPGSPSGQSLTQQTDDAPASETKSVLAPRP